MEIMRVIGIALLTTVAVIILKPHKPEIALIVSVTGGILTILLFVESLSGVIGGFGNIVEQTGVPPAMFTALIRIIGIGYLTEFGANICEDAGNQSMAHKVVIAGKVIILIMAIPIVTSLIDIITGVLP